MTATLFISNTSPYARKARVVARERGVEVDEVIVNPFADPDPLLGASAVGKVPVLVDGEVVVADSRVICEYLDAKAPGPRLLPDGDAAWIDRTRTAQADAIMDAALLAVLESRRVEGERSPGWIERQTTRALRVAGDAQPSDGWTLGDIALACALHYLDFRLPDLDWRGPSPALAAWHADVERRPSLASTTLG